MRAHHTLRIHTHCPREGRREGGREGGREGRREGRSEGGRKGGREGGLARVWGAGQTVGHNTGDTESPGLLEPITLHEE